MQRLSLLLTDQYQLTMAYGYWKCGKAEQNAVFQLSFRSEPFHGGYAIACGLADVIEYLNNFRFHEDELNYLAALKTSDDKPFFATGFIEYLRDLQFTCDIDAILEGTLVFAKEPMLRIKGPLLQCQLLETILLNLIGFATLAATKASRVCQAAVSDPVIEFGLRRAQGQDGGLTASRAAYIGGCIATSNVLAGKIYHIPIKGTMAHSWVMSFPAELEAFRVFADIIQDQTILVLDTYQTSQGIENAIIVAKELQDQGRELYGVRLDSGDLVTISKKVRSVLDQAGFNKVKIFASGGLDEYSIQKIKSCGAPIDGWGVGTKVVTCDDQPSLNVIYKLTAVQNAHGEWEYKAKISDEAEKSTLPGIQQVRRFYQDGVLLYDVIYDEKLGISSHNDQPHLAAEDLLQPIFRQGKLIYQQPLIQEIQVQAQKQVKDFLARVNTDTEQKFSVKIDEKLTVSRKITS